MSQIVSTVLELTWGYTMVGWLALSSHSRKVPISAGFFLCEVYMFSQCMWEFFLGTLASSYSPKALPLCCPCDGLTTCQGIPCFSPNSSWDLELN